MYGMTIVIIRDPHGCLRVYLGQKEEKRKENRVRKPMRRLWWHDLMNQGVELLTAEVYHRAMKQHLSDATFGAFFLRCN